MKKKVLAVLLATLMSATMFAGMATVTAEEDEYLKEVKDHVTPEQWVEIEKLIKESEGSKSLPDLEITSFEENADVLWAYVYNSGNKYASAFDVRFHVYYGSEWQAVGRDIVWLGLTIGSYVWTNSNTVQQSGSLYSRAWVDMFEKVPEEDDDNNEAYDTFTFS
jgi:hypothetical protein